MMITRRAFGVAFACFPLFARPSCAAEATRLRMGQLYDYDNGMDFSETAKLLAGKSVEMQGFMAPHLKVDSNFFILSNTPVETCPFCESEDDWIDTIVFVEMRKRRDAIDPGTLIWTNGILEIGPKTDPETGFVSRARLVEAEFRRA